jgi:hypothetical protein
MNDNSAQDTAALLLGRAVDEIGGEQRAGTFRVPAARLATSSTASLQGKTHPIDHQLHGGAAGGDRPRSIYKGPCRNSASVSAISKD